MMHQTAKFFIAAGVFLLVIGLIILLIGKTGFPIGHLPGDITYQKKNVTVFAPFGSMIVVSLLLSLLLNLISRWKH